MCRVKRCAVAYSLTRRVRAIPSVAVLDHMIIVAEVGYELTCSAPANHDVHWDNLSLGRAMNDEEEALQFREDVE
eukprot:6397853-Pyramimonas_sp.AAC.1